MKAYLKKGRLADILALIQVLALDKHAHRSENGLVEELQGSPTSASQWREVASDHPEFFRVRQRGEHIVSLTARHVLPEQEGYRPQLPTDFTHKLIQTAIELHDRELKRDQRWDFVTTAIITGAASMAGTFLAVYSGKP